MSEKIEIVKQGEIYLENLLDFNNSGHQCRIELY